MEIKNDGSPAPEVPSPGFSQKSQPKQFNLFKPISDVKETGALRSEVSPAEDLTDSPKPSLFDRIRSVFRSRSRAESMPSTPFSPVSAFASDLTTPEAFTPISADLSSAEEFLQSQELKNPIMKEPCQRALQRMQMYRAGYQLNADRSLEIQGYMRRQEASVERYILGDLTRGFDVTIRSIPLLSKDQIDGLKGNPFPSLEEKTIAQIQNTLDGEKVPVHVRPYLNQTIANQIFSVLQLELEEVGIPIQAEGKEGFGIALRRDHLTPVRIDLEETKDGWRVKGESVVVYQDTDFEKSDEDGWKEVGSFKIEFFVQIPNDPNALPSYMIRAS